MKMHIDSNKIREIESYFFSQGKNYLAKRAKDLDEIKNNLQNIEDVKRLEKIQKIGNKIKGTASLYGFSKLSDIGFRLELAAGNGDLTKLPNVVDEFQTFLNEIKNEME